MAVAATSSAWHLLWMSVREEPLPPPNSKGQTPGHGRSGHVGGLSPDVSLEAEEAGLAEGAQVDRIPLPRPNSKGQTLGHGRSGHVLGTVPQTWR
jgi:hypothetical protein